MKKTPLLVILFIPLLTVFLFSQTADTRGLQTVVKQLVGPSAVIGKQYAVLIAVDKYKNWVALRNPVKDAKEIKDILSRRYFISEFLELYDGAATKAGIIRLFERLIAITQPGDSVLIFYAGHGHLDKISNTGFWIPVDGGLDRYEQANWLPNAQIRGFVNNMKARHIALLADSCFSGDILNPTRGTTPEITSEYFRNAYSRVSRQVVTSGASETVPDESSFARQLKLALEGNASPYLDPLMLYNQIRLGVSGTMPLFGDFKDSGHQEGASFLLFLKEKAKAVTEEAASSEQPQETRFKIEKAYGKASVKTETAGTLFLDGVLQGQVPAGRVATIENLAFGNHELEMRYENGETEKRPITVDTEEAVSITFKKTAKKIFTIAFMPGIADPFYTAMERGIRAKAKELGVDIVVGDYPTQWGPEYQNPSLAALMAKGGIDLLLIAPTSTTAMVAPLKKLYDKGIPVITVDTYLGDGDYSKASDYNFPLAFIGTDNTLGGKQVAERLARLVAGKGKVYVVSTSPDASSIIDRGNGFKEGLAEFPGMQLVGMDYCMNVQQKAMEQTAAALRKNPDLVAIFGLNVFGAQGSAQAVKNAGRAGAVKIASWDATSTLIAALKAGDIDLVLAQLPGEMGALGVEAGLKYLTSKTAPQKRILTGFQFFTKDNANNADMQQYLY